MSHQDRREPLPKGYQFGDARLTEREVAQIMLDTALHVMTATKHMFPGSTEALAALDPIRYRAALGASWNVIEGEQN